MMTTIQNFVSDMEIVSNHNRIKHVLVFYLHHTIIDNGPIIP
jgi:hypothetical protein